MSFSISGALQPLASGATVNYSGPASGSVVADASGNYSISGLTLAGPYVVTPDSSSLCFWPVSDIVRADGVNNVLGQDFIPLSRSTVAQHASVGAGGSVSSLAPSFGGASTLGSVLLVVVCQNGQNRTVSSVSDDSGTNVYNAASVSFNSATTPTASVYMALCVNAAVATTITVGMSGSGSGWSVAIYEIKGLTGTTPFIYTCVGPSTTTTGLQLSSSNSFSLAGNSVESGTTFVVLAGTNGSGASVVWNNVSSASWVTTDQQSAGGMSVFTASSIGAVSAQISASSFSGVAVVATLTQPVKGNILGLNVGGPESITSVDNAVGGLTSYHGTFTVDHYPTSDSCFITGFVTHTVNNGTFVIVSVTPTVLTVINAAGVSETHAATVQHVPPGSALRVNNGRQIVAVNAANLGAAIPGVGGALVFTL